MPLVFFLAGGMLASFAARVPALEDRFALSDSALGLAFVCLEAGPGARPPPCGAPCAPPRGPRGASLRLGAVAFCAFLVDGAANNWSAVQVRGAGGDETLAAATFAVFAAALALGRLFGDRVAPPRGAGLVAASGVVVAVLSSS